MDSVGKIFITSALVNKLDIPITTSIKVRAGVKTVISRLIVEKSRKYNYILSQQLAAALNIYGVKKLQIRYDHDDEAVHIGPIIGIMTGFLPNRREYSAKSVQAELIYLSNVGLTLPALCYIFTPDSVDWTNKTVRGHIYQKYYRSQGGWLSAQYPLPDVIYDRVSNRRREALDSVKNIKKRLMNLPCLKYFNPAFLNKWRVHELLAGNESLIPFLPETKPLNSTNLTDMFERYNTLYLKPCNGSQGKGIIKVVNNNGRLHYTIYKSKKHSGYADEAVQLINATSFCRGERSYIIQEGIDLATYMRSAFDIRIIYQKNREGEWVISKKFVRIAPLGSSITNLSRGGTAATSKEVFAELFKQDQEIIRAMNNKLENMCKLVAETLDSASQQTFGELGLDVGIDQEGNFKLIEVNSKPRKTTQTDLSRGIVRNTFRRPLEYSIYLAGFNKFKN